MMISEKMVFTSSNGNHLVLYARPPAGISIQKCSVRSSFLLNKNLFSFINPLFSCYSEMVPSI